jgi:DsbC/DsbD-like thiol-disulfide interchange protein
MSRSCLLDANTGRGQSCKVPCIMQTVVVHLRVGEQYNSDQTGRIMTISRVTQKLPNPLHDIQIRNRRRTLGILVKEA